MKPVFPYLISVLVGLCAAFVGMYVIHYVTNFLYWPPTDNPSMVNAFVGLVSSGDWFRCLIAVVNYIFKPLFIFYIVQVLFWYHWIRKLNT